MKRLMALLLMSLAAPTSCWAVVGQVTELKDDQMAMAPLLTDYVDMIQLGAQKGRHRFYGLQIGGPCGLSTREYRLHGVQVGLGNEVMMGRMCGLQIGIGNTVRGWGWSHDDDVTVNGLQLGIVNVVKAPKGNIHGVFCQIGLLNIVECSGATAAPYLPLLRVWW